MLIRELIEQRPVEDLVPHPKHNLYNSSLDEIRLSQLEDSIFDLGIQEPLLITEDNVIICGHERKRAAENIRLKTVPVRVVVDASEGEILYLMVSGNEARRGDERDLIRKARKAKVLCEHYGVRRGRNKKGVDERVTLEDIGESMGLSKRNLTRLFKLLSLIPELQKMVSDDRIGIGVGNELATLPIDEQRMFYESLKDSDIKEITAEEVKAICAELRATREKPNTASPSTKLNPPDKTPNREEEHSEVNDDAAAESKDTLSLNNPQYENRDETSPFQNAAQNVEVREESKEQNDSLTASEEEIVTTSSEVEATAKPEVDARTFMSPRITTSLVSDMPKRALDAVAPMFKKDNAENIHRRVFMSKLEKSRKQIDKISNDLLPSIEEMCKDPVTRTTILDFVLRVNKITSLIQGVVGKYSDA